MENATISLDIVEAAAQRSYPTTLQGFTPKDYAYWKDPLVQWRPGTEAERAAVTDRRGQRKVWRDIWLQSDLMAPRFLAGTCVAIDPVHGLDELELGRVYVRWEKDGKGRESWCCARLAAIGEGCLMLTEDNGGAEQRWPLAWDAPERWCLYEITHYCSWPAL